MNAPGKLADQRAKLMVDRLIQERATGERVLALLNEIARNPRHLNYVPHLVTAIRKAESWPSLRF